MIKEEKLKNANVVDFFSDLTEEERTEAELMASIAMAIHNKRVSMDMSQKEFAKLNGVTQGMVSKWESGEYNFTLSSLSKIMAALGIKIVFQEEQENVHRTQNEEFKWEAASSGGGSAFAAYSVAASPSAI